MIPSPRHADDLDRLLSSEPLLDPGPAFARDVMRAILRESRTPPPIPFPWRRALAVAGGGLLLALAVAIVWPILPSWPAFAGAAEAFAGSAAALAKGIAAQVPRAATLQFSLALLATWLMVRWSFRLAGSRG